MTKLKHAAETLHAAKRPFVLVSVKDGTGSMPRHQGAIMLVRQDGSIVGTIGGGLLEAQAIRAAQKVFAAKRDMEQPFQLTGKQAAQDGMICGGSGTLTFRYCPPEQPLPELPEESGMLYIFGGGHVGQALAQGAVLLGWPVTVLDDRAAYADPARFPETACITVPGFDSLPDLPVGPADGIVIVTRGHLGDADVLRWAVQQNAGYIGMIGSKRRKKAFHRPACSRYTLRSGWISVQRRRVRSLSRSWQRSLRFGCSVETRRPKHENNTDTGRGRDAART